MLTLLLLFLFIGLPILELAVLLRVAQVLHVSGTLALVLVTGVIGVMLARQQGLRTLARIQHDMNEGRMPAPHLVDGFLILVAGIVLMTPGLITDCAGFFLLIPAGRALVKRWVRQRIEEKMQQGTIDVVYRE